MNIRAIYTACAVLFLFVEETPASPVFLENVSESTGWYDCNKKTKWEWGTKPSPNPLNPPVSARPSEYYSLPIDSQLCWAAAASNVLQWWQDTRSDIAATTPNGKSATYDAMPEVSQLAIYQTISKSWTNGGGSVEQAWNWWFNGGMLPNVFYGTESRIQENPFSEGGYWKDLNLTVTYTQDGGAIANTPLFNSYSFWNGDGKNDIYAILRGNIDNNWGTTLTIGQEGHGHAITMWGYDTDAQGNLIVYLTDSDDYKSGLFRQKVVVDAENYIYLTSVDGEADVYDYVYDDVGLTGCQLGEIQGFTAPAGNLGIPEPSIGLLSLCGIFFFLGRRKRP